MMGASLEDLIKQGDVFSKKVQMTRIDNFPHIRYDLRADFYKWERICLLFLQTNYTNCKQTTEFERVINSDNSNALETTHQNLMAILNAIKMINPIDEISENDSIADRILSNIFNNFSRFILQLKRTRHDGRDCFITDEYDVQDLLHAVLKLHFDDVIDEESVPQNAGSSNRMDFLINDIRTAIEVKYAKDTHKDKQIGQELIVDIDKYSRHPNCKSLYCFIYDPNHCIVNPRTLEKDLNNKSTDDFKVKVFVRPLE